MKNKIEMSLDDIIKSTKNPRRSGRTRGSGREDNQRRGNFRNSGRSGSSGTALRGRRRGVSRSYTRGDVNVALNHDLFDGFGSRKVAAARAAVQATMGPTKLVISNLHFGVSDSDIQELFAEFGLLRRTAIHYDRSGRSLGTADVIFEKRSDAIKAMKQYNGVPLDGRAMNIQLTTPEVLIPMKIPVGERKIHYTRPKRDKFGPSSGGRRGGQNARNQRQPPTAEKLDAELEAYASARK
ncbi:THO complex subunit 4-like [Leptinotarsa decemlineata]|uniref:THO complex subunit 4-like n=1 Tax=Leptinotarsa decemlineata TaxID=7539 RepID=UPI003D305D58